MTTKTQRYEYEIKELKEIRTLLKETELTSSEKREVANALLLMIQEVKNSDPHFITSKFTHGLNGHHETYLNYADMNLNRFYSDIEFIINQLRAEKTKIKPIMQKLDEMIQTNLYMDDVQKYIDNSMVLHYEESEPCVLQLSDRVPGEYTFYDEL